MISLNGGPRPFAREGFLAEEETNWRRAEQQVVTGLAANRHTRYHVGTPSQVTSRAFNRAAIRLRTNPVLRRFFLAGNEMHGRLAMPLLTLHTTGDGQVPIDQLGILRRRVRAAGTQRLLASRVFVDPGHCGFTYTEWATALKALVRWVEHGVRPRGNDPRHLRPRFELSPRPGTPEADRVPGARRRLKVSGRFTLDGARFDARFLGAAVVRGGLVTACQLELGLIRRGRGSVEVMAAPEAAGCGRAGARVALWTVDEEGRIVFSRSTWHWPRDGRLSVRGSFASDRPNGTVRTRADFYGSAYTARGDELPGGTLVEAFIGPTRCGVASLRRTGSFSGYSLSVVGPEAVAGCRRGGTIRFRVNGRRAPETALNDPGRASRLDLTAR